MFKEIKISIAKNQMDLSVGQVIPHKVRIQIKTTDGRDLVGDFRILDQGDLTMKNVAMLMEGAWKQYEENNTEKEPR